MGNRLTSSVSANPNESAQFDASVGARTRGTAPHHFSEKRPEFHYLRKPTGFTTGMAWGNLAYQMRYSVETLEKHLVIEGTPHVLQLNMDRKDDDWQNPTGWCLYADGREVASGSGAFARQCFEESAGAFRDACRKAVSAAKLEQLTDREYWLLDRARAIAAVEPFDDGSHVMGGRPFRV